jgi:two-component system OmpR family response regulator
MKIWPPASPVCAAVVVRAEKRILVVDDDQIICDFMADVLRDEGWSVTIAHNGAEALIQMRATVHDLVLLDLMMPVLDGWAVLAERQTDANLRAVPVLAMSAGGNGCMDRATALGANRCIPKPFELDAILDALESMRNRGVEADS